MIEAKQETEGVGELNNWLMTLFARAAVLILCLPVHECAHAYVAYRMGDSTAKDQGRITLNPLAHLSPVGAVAILACGIGWAKPVPIDARYFKNPKLGMALSDLAGPVANLLCGLVGMVLFKILAYSPLYDLRAVQAVGTLLLYIVRVNLSLAVFNLLPIPPLDGSRLATYFLPRRLYFQLMQYEQFIMIGLLAVLWLGLLDTPLRILNNALFMGMDWITGFIDVIGRWFLLR